MFRCFVIGIVLCFAVVLFDYCCVPLFCYWTIVVFRCFVMGLLFCFAVLLLGFVLVRFIVCFLGDSFCISLPRMIMGLRPAARTFARLFEQEPEQRRDDAAE